jgi:hypothetical protein
VTSEVLIIAALLGLIPATLASRKGGSFFWWWIFGAVIFIVALPMALLKRDETHAECPFCREAVRVDATVCPHCQREITLRTAQS